MLPPHTLDQEILGEITAATRAMALELGVLGLMNVQFAVKGEDLFALEVNPHASRTVPFVSKATNVPLANLAAKVMCGKSLAELGYTSSVTPSYLSVKVPVLPFNKFPTADMLLSPEMRSTGEVMGIEPLLGFAFQKAYEAAEMSLPRHGRVLLTVKAADKRAIVPEARLLENLGYQLLATEGTWRTLKSNGTWVERVNKGGEGRPHIVDLIKNKNIDLVLNTPFGKKQRGGGGPLGDASGGLRGAQPAELPRPGAGELRAGGEVEGRPPRPGGDQLHRRARGVSLRGHGELGSACLAAGDHGKHSARGGLLPPGGSARLDRGLVPHGHDPGGGGRDRGLAEASRP